LGSWDLNKSIRVTVLLWLDENSYSYYNQIVYRSALSGGVSSQVWSALTYDLPDIVGCKNGEDCAPLIWLSVMITIFIIGAVGATVIHDISFLMLLGVVCLGFFTMIGWVPMFWLVFAIFVIFAGLISAWRIL